MPPQVSLGERFARSLAEKQFDAVAALLSPGVDFRALTPGRAWEAGSPEEVVAILGRWFEPGDHITALERLECDAFADRERVGYRLAIDNDEGSHLLEQQAYIAADGERIGWLRILCSGYRPIAPSRGAG